LKNGFVMSAEEFIAAAQKKVQEAQIARATPAPTLTPESERDAKTTKQRLESALARTA
jgi:hypothetical protein